ncbi:syntaxin 7-like protein [Plasmopara halstedii]|uniref:Syntaxin 7-like protein n=1 Tax=Plasmopara halstedii TaxID=4781 RepID=A0A0P1B595_PLAHL|nr:syntaxin 7-like protein [Plasmopara halstedii]CEG49146.1 syntaxin 7-like protein [Plasmopara halstedii]|eukprot:XP_024585515.1 syntaxin 7-like protein [Plasmopara halstedii]
MGDRYRSAQSPRDNNGSMTDDRFNKLVTETSKGISSFNQLTRSIAQKMSLFGTPQDSRANHVQIKEITEKGNKLVTKINRRLQELNRGAKGASGRTRRTQVNKLSADFKTQVRVFEETCERLLQSERQSVEFIRRSSQSFNSSDKQQSRGGAAFTNYSEDQIYAQANVIIYDEDDMQRREDDIIQINNQLREVNAAFTEIDGLVQDQGELVVEIVDNTETAKDNVEKALEQVRQAEQRKKCCACSRLQLFGVALLMLLIFVAVIGVLATAK